MTKQKGDKTGSILWICANLHQAVKKSLPTFTLDRGFEFSNAAIRGERQCLLQSVWIASLLRELKVDAGIAMVWKNDKGQVSNMGHVCAVAALPNGQRVVVDCSDPQPFIEHRGLFMSVEGAGYRFVEPSYKHGIMVSAKDLKTDKVISSDRLKTLDESYVRSQFSFYRGERAPGGFMGKPPTKAGLAASEKLFRLSMGQNPNNPLSTWLLSLTLGKQGKLQEAKVFKDQARNLYEKFGWIPPSLK